MARPRKEGLEYFPHDVYASADEKVEPLVVLHGAKGYAFFFMHLEYIYRRDDLKLNVNGKTFRKSICARMRITEEEYDEILGDALECGLFDAEQYNATGELTSDGIKRRGEAVLSEREKERERKTGGKPAENHGNEEFSGSVPEFSGSFPAENSGFPAEPFKKGKGKGKEISYEISPSSCAEPAQAPPAAPQVPPPPAEPAVLVFPLARKGETFPVTQSDIDEWRGSYPGADVERELLACLQWNRDNPTRRKTRSGIRKHISAWLAKAQDRAPARASPPAAPPYPMTPQQRYMHELGNRLIPDEPEDNRDRVIIDITPNDHAAPTQLGAAERRTGAPGRALPAGGP